jgi:FMN phosphatase YigB (HAD superfamily)
VPVTRVLVLDLWGTLVATPEAARHQKALAEVAGRLGVEPAAFAEAYEAKRTQRDTGSWTRDAPSGSPLEAVYLKRLVVQSFPALATSLTDDDIAEAARPLFDDTVGALAESRLVQGVLDSLQAARNVGSLIVVCTDAGPWMRAALEHCALLPYLDAIVVSAETGVRKPEREMYDTVVVEAQKLLAARSDSRPPQFVFIADGGSQDHHDRLAPDGSPYTELHGADDAEFDSVLQVDHFHEVDGELRYDRRDVGWPEMLSFHDVPTALFALNARP